MSDQVFYLFSAVLLGLVLGALFMYFASGANKDSNETIMNLEKKLSNYQEDVSNHFEETADLIDEMTNSYKKVFDHLNKSARKLMTEEQIQQQLEKRKGNKVTLEFLTEEGLEGQLHSVVEKSELEGVHIDKNHEDTNEEDVAVEEEKKEDKIVEVDIEEQVNEEVVLEKEVEMREKNIYT
jgi:hypothetical protein